MKEINEIKKFTYHDYIYYKKFFKKNKYDEVFMLCETEEKYSYRKQINKPHDKIFKDVLDDKKEVVTFLNERLKLANTKYALKEDDLEKYNREFITENFQSIESDIIYKKKNQNIFFLIEQQSTIEPAMSYRIMKYQWAIIESAIEKEKLRQKDYKLPSVISFVIYTGTEKWEKANYLIDKQEKLLGCKPEFFENFQFINVNEYTKQELLDKEGFLTKVMLLEKAKNYEELEEYLELIMERHLEDRHKELLQRMIKYVYKNKLSNKKYNKFIQELQINQEKGGDSMFAEILSKKIDEVFEMEEKVKKEQSKVKKQESKVKEQETKVKEQELKIKEREKKLEKQEAEIKQEKNNIIMNMLKNNIDENTILKIVNIDKSRLIKIKKQMMAS